MTDTQTDFDFLPLRVIGKTADGKNRYDRESKRKLIEACQKPRASVAGLALKAGVNTNQLRKWISLDRKKNTLPICAAAGSEPCTGIRSCSGSG